MFANTARIGQTSQPIQTIKYTRLNLFVQHRSNQQIKSNEKSNKYFLFHHFIILIIIYVQNFFYFGSLHRRLDYTFISFGVWTNLGLNHTCRTSMAKISKCWTLPTYSNTFRSSLYLGKKNGYFKCRFLFYDGVVSHTT